MLVLTRKVGERIFIGDNISVTIVRVAQGGVRIGIEAPADMPVLREEVRNNQATDTAAREVIEPVNAELTHDASRELVIQA